MDIKNHILQGIEYDAAKRIKDPIVPQFIVMHYTAGYSMSSARNVFNTTDIAAHITIDTDGTILQMVPFNRGANHAGPSKWGNMSYLNNSSIGIEHVNIGFLKKVGNTFIDAYGNIWRGNPADLIEAKHSRVGSGTYYWPKYPEAQIEASRKVVAAILGKYDIKDIVSHEEIDTRGWKTDPGPAFPLNSFRDMLRESGPLIAQRFEVTSDTLNVRGGPGANYPTVTRWPLHKGQQVELVMSYGTWAKVLINDYVEGFIHTDYVKRV